MATFNDVYVDGDDWVNVNALSTIAVGAAFNIQNKSTGSCLLQESTTKPTNDYGAVLYPPSYDNLSKAIVAAGSVTMWAKAVEQHRPTILAIYE